MSNTNPPPLELIPSVVLNEENKLVQKFTEMPVDQPVDKPVPPNVPAAREILAQDTFSTEAEPEKRYKLTVEFMDELGARRRVDLVEPMTEAQGFLESEQYRQAGEIILQLIRQSEIKP